MLQVIFTNVVSPRTRVHCLAYTMADFTRSQPVARIVKTGDDTFRAEGYKTGAVVAEGTMAECYDALRNYGGGATSYGDPDTDYRLLAL